VYIFKEGKPHDYEFHHTVYCNRTWGPTSDFGEDSGFPLYLHGLNTFDQMPAVPSFVVAAADAKVFSGIDVNLAEDIATFRQTIGLAGNLVANGLDLLHAFRKRNLKEGSKALADAWLLFQYGIKPIVSDVIGVLKFKLPEVIHIKSKGESSVTNGYSTIPGWAFCQIDGSYRLGCNTSIAYAVDDPSLAALASFGLLNPFELAWELIPFSFVVDWFVNVGDIIAGFSPNPGLRFLYGERVYWWKMQYTASWVSSTQNAQWIGQPKQEKAHGKAMKRVILDTWPIPPVAFNGGLNLTRLVTALALIRQRA
jgi:hypothetical protein